MKRLALFIALAVSGGLVQAQTRTTVRDVLYNADGSRAAGQVQISWPAFTAADGKSVAAGKLTRRITEGVLDVSLVPTVGATPAGITYTAGYLLTNGTTYEEKWTIPSSGPVSVSEIRTVSTAATAGNSVPEHQITLGSGLQVLLGLQRASSPPQATNEGQCYWDTGEATIKCSNSAGSNYRSVGGAPTGAAGGELAGVYPNPTLGATIGGAKTFSGSIDSPKINAIRYAPQFAGADACAKIAAAITDLPATGGTVDARGFEGEQACDTAPFPLVQKPVSLLLGGTTYTTSVEWLPAPGNVIHGLGVGHYNQPGARTTVIKPVAGFTPASVVHFDADYLGGGTGMFMSAVGMEGVLIDMTNVSAAGKIALNIRSVSNTGPWRDLTVINQDTGQYLYVGRSTSPVGAVSDGLTFQDFYTLAKTRAAPWVRGDNDPCVVIEEANEIDFIGGRTKFQCAAGTSVNSPSVVVRTNGASGVNHINFEGVSFTQGTVSPSLLVTYVSGSTGPHWVRVVNSTFEGYNHAIELSGGSVIAGTDPRFGYFAGNRFISPTGANPSNYYVGTSSGNLIISDEYASQTVPGTKAVTLTANASSNTVLGGSQGYVSDSGTGNAACTRAAGGVYSCNHGLDTGTGSLSFNSDAFIQRDAANILSVRNGANPQEFDLYKSYTDAGNWERMTFRADSTYFRLYSEKAGTGTSRSVIFGTGGSASVYFLTGGTFRWLFDGGGNFLTYADNTYDLGAAASGRPRIGYFGTSLIAPVLNATTGFQVNGAAASGQYLRGDGTNFVAAGIGGGDLPNPAVGTKGGVEAKVCTGTDKLSAIGTDGVPVCSPDQTGSAGSGITTLNGLTAGAQSFSKADDTNVTLAIGTSGLDTHTFALGWTGTLAKIRQNAATAYTDAANGWSVAQTPGAAGTADLGSAALPWRNLYVGSVATNNNKIASAATTAARTFTLPDADSNPIRPTACAGTDKVRAIGSDGTVTCAADQAAAGSGYSALAGDTGTASKTGAESLAVVGAAGEITTVAGDSTNDTITVSLPATLATNKTITGQWQITRAASGADDWGLKINAATGAATGTVCGLCLADQTAGATANHNLRSGPEASAFNAFLAASGGAAAANVFGARDAAPASPYTLSVLGEYAGNGAQWPVAIDVVTDVTGTATGGSVITSAQVEGYSHSAQVDYLTAISAWAWKQGTGNVSYGTGADVWYDNGGTAGNTLQADAVKGTIYAEAGTVTAGAAFRARSAGASGGGAITDNVAFLAEDQTAGVNNWAIRTGLGLVEFGDLLKLNGNATSKRQLALPSMGGDPASPVTGDLWNNAGALKFYDGATKTIAFLDSSITGNAQTASALAADPADCGANTVANAIAASGNLSCVTVTSAYTDTSIAHTGVDVNTSYQVTATHLAAALPVNQGGTGTTTTLTGLVRGSASAMTAAELSGDVTTSGSNAATLAARYKTRSCELHIWGSGASSVLQDGDDEPSSCLNTSGADWTITGVTCWADAGTPSVLPILTGGAANSIITGGTAFNCGNATWAGGTLNGSPVVHSATAAGSCSVAPCTVDANIATAGGTAHSIRLVITYTF